MGPLVSFAHHTAKIGFQNNGGSVSFNFPNSPNIATPGYYMLFFLNGAGVPSHAKILFLGNGGGGPVANPGAGPGIPGGGGATTPPPAGGGNVNANANANGVYSMAVLATNRCIDIPGNSPDDNIQAQQYDCNGTNAQRSTVKKTGKTPHQL
ncbi:MAG: DUF1929 domain-containing protein [Oligoflexus sp.]|nr:DUF1929 domain-containing protein [Oligoflexus sp.]